MSDGINIPGGGGAAGDGAIPASKRYLWDGTGPVDAAVALLERAAEPMRFRARAALLSGARRRGGAGAARARGVMAAAATVVLCAGLVIWLLVPRGPAFSGRTWTIARSPGASVTGPVTDKTDSQSVGCTVAPSAPVACSMTAPGGTRVEVLQGASVRAIDRGEGVPRVELEQGRMVVEVGPGAAGVEVGTMGQTVGCTAGSRLTIDAAIKGSAVATVEQGRAEVVRGAMATRAGPGMQLEIGPDGEPLVPFRKGADAEMVDRLRKLEAEMSRGSKMTDLKSQWYLIDQLSQRCKPADAPMLWNVMVRVDPNARRAVRDILAKLLARAPGPPEFDDVLKLEPRAVEAWWRAAEGAK